MASDTDLEAIYRDLERALITECKKAKPDIEQVLDAATSHATIDTDDNALFRKLVMVVFYSGFKAATVTAKKDTILRHLGDWQRVKDYVEADVARVLADDDMIGNRRKVEACVVNAKKVEEIRAKHGSFGAYLRDLAGARALSDLLVMKEDLEAQFQYLGGITVYHFMTDIGLDVLKPDRVIMRILHRLGLVEDRDRYFRAVQIGQRMAAATGTSLRKVDRVLVAYGQVTTEEFGLARGICLEDEPRCDVCGVRDRCAWAAAPLAKG